MKRRRCPYCRKAEPAVGVVFAFGMLVGALLLALAMSVPLP